MHINIYILRVGHDNGGTNPSWHLEEVYIECVELGRRWMFPAKRWLAKDKELNEDGLTEVELKCRRIDDGING